MHRPLPKTPQLWYGANFWSRAGGPLMWRNYDGQVVRQELAVLSEHSLNMTRSFFYWPDFQPEPDLIDQQLCERYADFLDAHLEYGMTTIPTFLVGHMSGENWDPAWRAGRDIYTDVVMVGHEVFYVTELTRRFAAHPAVSGWLISNEIPIYGGEADRATIDAWARIMVNAVRAGGGWQPVSLGDGAWGVEVTGHDSGFSVRDLAQLCDFVGPHVYRMDTDIVRQHLNAAFACELAHFEDKPVVMEEFGLSTDFASHANAGHYYRQLLTNTLLAGAYGWIAWNNTDYDALEAQRPYLHHPFEMHFGITDQHGKPKSPLLAMQDFKVLIDRLDLPACGRVEAQVALVVTSYLDSNFQFHEATESRLVAGNAQQGYIACKEAGLPVAVVRESATGGVAPGARLYLLPSIKELTGPTWSQLIELAEVGATIWASYCAGEADFQRGPWWHRTSELFGVRNDLVYGLNNRVDADLVELTFTADLGDLHAGDTLRFRVAGNQNSRAFLPVEVTTGTVIARDQDGRPAIVMQQHGAGRAVLCTYPLEYFAARTRGVNPEDTWRIYRGLAQLAQVQVPVRVDDPRVLVDGLRHADGREFWFLVSEHADEVVVEVTGDNLTRLDGTAADRVHLAPWGVELLIHQEA